MPSELNGRVASVLASPFNSARPRHPPGPHISNTSHSRLPLRVVRTPEEDIEARQTANSGQVEERTSG